MSLRELTSRLLALEADPAFERLDRQLGRTNAFRLLGRTYTETWHSAFWGWVFDPKGSHGLGDFALRRLLVRLADDDGRFRGVWLEPAGAEGDWRLAVGEATPLDAGDLLGLQVLDSVAAPAPDSDFQELPIVGIGAVVDGRSTRDSRLDGIYAVRVAHPRLAEPVVVLVVLEFKVKARYEPAQLSRYSAWLHANPSTGAVDLEDFEKALERVYGGAEPVPALLALGGWVAVAPRPAGSPDAPENLDPAWTTLTYGELVADILEPMLEHPNLDAESASFARSYVDMAAHPESTIMTRPSEAQTRLVREFLDRHSDTFDLIVQVLRQGDAEEEARAEAIQAGQPSPGRAPGKKRPGPAALIEAGLLRMGETVVHHVSASAGFDGPLRARVVAAGSRFLQLIEGGDVELDGPRSAGGLLTEVYRANGSKFHDSGNRAWTLESGSRSGQTLAALYDELAKASPE